MQNCSDTCATPGVRRSTGWDPWSAVPWELCSTTSCCSPVCAACLRGSPRWRAPGLRRPRASRRPGESPLSSKHRPYKPAEEVKLLIAPPPRPEHQPEPEPPPPQDCRTQTEGQKKACHWRKHREACGAGSPSPLAHQLAITAQDRALSLSPSFSVFFFSLHFSSCFLVGYRSEATVEQQTSANFSIWSNVISPFVLLTELGSIPCTYRTLPVFIWFTMLFFSPPDLCTFVCEQRVRTHTSLCSRVCAFVLVLSDSSVCLYQFSADFRKG